MDNYRPPSFDFMSSEYKKAFVAKAKKMSLSNAELQARISEAWLDIDDREELLDKIEALQKLRSEQEWAIIKKTQLMWDI